MIFDKGFSRPTTVKAAKAGEPETNNGSAALTLAQLVDAFGLQGVSRDRLSEATYFACLRVLSETLGKLPLKLNQTTDELGTVSRPEHPYYSVCRFRPNPFESASGFWTTTEFFRNHYGNAYVHIKLGRNGRPQLWRLPSNQVDIWWDNAKLLSETPHIWYRWSAPNGKRYLFTEEEVLHFRTWLSFDGLTGLSVRDILKVTLDGCLSAEDMLNNLYKNGMTGKAVLQYTGDLNGDLEKSFVENLQQYVDGKVDGARSLIPLPLGSTLTPLNIKLADSQFVEVRKYTALQVAAAFGVKPDQINDYSKSSYSSSEAQQIAFLVDTLLWILEHYEQELTYKLLSSRDVETGYAYKFNAGAILRTTTAQQISSLKEGVSGMIYKPNEARRHLDMSAVPEGDKLYAGNGSVIPLELAGRQYTNTGGDE